MKKTIMTVLALATMTMGATAHDDDKKEGKDFGGFYLGWDAGISEPSLLDADTSKSRNYSTFFLGWRKATDSGFVYGIELLGGETDDGAPLVTFSDTTIGSDPARVREWTTREGNGDLKLTFGKLLGKNRSTLVFMEGGYSGLILNDERRERIDPAGRNDFNVYSTERTLDGYTLGVGVEHKISNTFGIRARFNSTKYETLDWANQGTVGLVIDF